MMINSKIAASDFGEYFTHDGDCVAWWILGGFWVFSVMASPIVTVTSLYSIFWVVLAVVTVIALFITYSKYNRLADSTQSALDDYWSLTKDERNLLPKGTEKRIIEHNHASVSRPISTLVSEIKSASMDHGKRDFLDQIENTRQVIRETAETNRKLGLS